MAQNKATKRTALRSAVAHRKLADTMLDNIKLAQTQLNAALAKLDADTSAALDTDYATLAIPSAFDADAPVFGQHKQSARKTLRSALKHKRAADEIVDTLEETQLALNALLLKLDAQGGTLADTDFEATLGLTPLDLDAPTFGQHKQSLRKTVISGFARTNLANDVLEALLGLQNSLVASAKQLDLGNVAGAHASLQVDVLDPDA